METNNYVIGDTTRKILDSYKLLNNFWATFSEAIMKTYGEKNADTLYQKLDLEMSNVLEMVRKILVFNISNNFEELKTNQQ
jgi:hypothetical protein